MAEIFHVADRETWESVRAAGGPYEMSTRGRTLADEGFIHCCATEEQVVGVLQRHYADAAPDDLVLLVIDPTALDVRYERSGDDTFPHVYGPVPLAAVIGVGPAPRPGRLSRGGFA